MAVFKIRPGALSSTYNGVWTLGAGSSILTAVDPGPNFTDDDATSYALSVAAPTTSPLSSVCQGFVLGTRPEIATITDISIRIRANTDHVLSDPFTVAGFFRLAGFDGTAVGLTNIDNSGWRTANVSMWNYRPTGGQWSVDDIFDPSLEVVIYVSAWVSGSGQKCELTTVWVEVTGTATPSQILQAREIASRRLRLRRRPQRIFTFKNVGPAALDIDPLGQFAVTHQAIPNAAGAGAGDLNWQRRLMREVGQDSFDMDNLVFQSFSAIDLRRQLVTLWDTCLAVRPGPTAHGVARWDIGLTRSFTRASLAWIPDSGSVVRQIGNDEEAVGLLGSLMTRPSTNYQIQSSFRNGSGTTFTGWTFTAGSGTIAEDTGDLIFDPNVVGRSVKITAGSPHSTESSLAGTTTASITATGNKVTVWVDYLSTVTGSGAWAWRLQRGSDSKWWDGSAWQVAQQTNNVNPAAGARGTLTSTVDIGGSTTLTLTLVIPSGGTAGRVVHFYHAQIEDLPWGSSRIVTDTASVTRAQARLLYSNNNTARFWRRNSGTFFVGFRPRWSSGANVSGYTFTLASCVFDANNGMWIYYDGTNSQWVFRRKAAGTTYDAIRAVSVINSAFYMVVARWAGSDGELGLTPLTQSIFVNGAKGTDVVSVRPTEVNTANGALGGEETTANTADGNIHDIAVTEQVLTDQEIGWISANGGSW